WWLDPKDPHRVAYTTQGFARPDRAGILGLQPGLCPGSERAYLAGRLGRDHDGWGAAAGGGGEGVQADRGNLREIPDRVGLGRNARARGSRRRLGVADDWRQGDVKRLEE